MINLYKFHSNPDTLLEYNNRIKLIPELAYDYARNVIKSRWPEGEPTIMKDPYWAVMYAQHIIKGRWPDAEPYIIKTPGVCNGLCYVCNKR